VVAAPTYHAFSIRVVGKAAHAGVEPERGISAIVVAAQALTRLPWGRLDESTTANVGTIQGGSVRNAVAAEAHLHGEVRSLVPERAATAVNAVRNTFEAVARDAGASADVDSQELYTGYVLADDDAVVALARGAFAAIDAGGTSTSTSIRSGGGSDANELNARGVRACVLGIGAQDCHSVRERISVQQLELLTVWMLAILERATIA
jgi:tripeptide aminopeptidase